MQTYLTAIEHELERVLRAPDRLGDGLVGMLRYHLGWVDADLRPIHADPGKRMRPLLVLCACAAVGGDWPLALPAAAAIELVHNFSLIHDDIEDNSDERRGRAALWKVWGMPQGINAGDAMFVLARLALDGLSGHPRYAKVHRAFDDATLALTEGQYLDLMYETRGHITEADYWHMVGHKTGALLTASAQIGALVGTADPAAQQALVHFGREMGAAFQVTDDILGLWGDPAVTGKSAASDILSRKKSLPVLYALGLPEMESLRAWYAQPVLQESDVPGVLALLERAGARAYAQNRAEQRYHAGMKALERFSPSAAQELRQLADSVVRRVK